MGRRREDRLQRTDGRILSRRIELAFWRSASRWSSSSRTEGRSQGRVTVFRHLRQGIQGQLSRGMREKRQ
eukprot:54817-Heterocapsa_arctica.AAC.1